MRVNWDAKKSALLKREHGYSFEESLEMFTRPYVVQHKNDDPDQFKAFGMIQGRLITLIIEIRHDDEGEYEWFVTLWKSTRNEVSTYEQNS